jgi:hypothetical protein
MGRKSSGSSGSSAGSESTGSESTEATSGEAGDGASNTEAPKRTRTPRVLNFRDKFNSICKTLETCTVTEKKRVLAMVKEAYRDELFPSDAGEEGEIIG